MSDFEWPCKKRHAHGPHDRQWAGGDKAGQRLYLVGGGKVTTEQKCPGVRAHPDTMIGRFVGEVE